MVFGSGKYSYKLVEGWGQLPEGWEWGWIPAVACDSQDRVFVYSRSEHPLVVFDREGNFLDSWGEDLLEAAHGIWIDENNNVYCTEYATHCIHKFGPDGELLMTLGTPGQPGAEGEPFDKPTDVVTLPSGELFVSDGYGNARVHKYSSDAELLQSWGERGEGPGQFELSHCVRVDRHGRLWVCDRTNDRIQVFDTDGNFLNELGDLLKPDTIYIDPNEDVLYVAELTQRVSILTLKGELLARWGGAEKSDRPGEFCGSPHGVWVDSRGDLYVGQVHTDGGLQKFERC